jgi:purine-nucleoside phosphorylase
MNATLLQRLDDAADAIRRNSPAPPDVGIVLGSGLDAVAALLRDPVSIPYDRIPHWPHTDVPGHAGCLQIGPAGGKTVAVLRGRVHVYEGHPLDRVVFPARVLARLGVKTAILTNAAGGLNPDYRPGDLMMLSDHLNLLGADPLAGPDGDALGPRFLDLAKLYDPELRASARAAAQRLGIPLREGVYAAAHGPCYETPAEARMIRGLGADAVGMSTVPEAIALHQCGVRVLAFSGITNVAAGLASAPLRHEDVLAANHRLANTLAGLVKAALEIL